MTDNFSKVSYLGTTGTTVGPRAMSGTEFRTMWQYGDYMFGGVGAWASPTSAYGQILVQKSPSRPGEFHPEPLTDPDRRLSPHPARATQRRPTPSGEKAGFLRSPVDPTTP